MPRNHTLLDHGPRKPLGRSGVVFAALACVLIATGCATPSSQVEEQPGATAESNAPQLAVQENNATPKCSTLQKSPSVLMKPEEAAADPQVEAVVATKTDGLTLGPKYHCASPTNTAPPSWPGKKVRFAFDFQNVGDEILTLKAKAGWGVKVIGRSDRKIAPGQSAKVEIETRTSTRSGGFVKKIRITTNDPAHKSMTVECKGSVLVAAKLAPTVANFGKIARSDGPQHRKITVKQGDGGPIDPKVLPIRTPGVEAALTTISPGAHYELDVTLSPPWPNGRLRTSIMLQTGVKENPRFPVRLIAQIPPRVRVVPSVFQVAIGQPETELSVNLSWIDKSGHKITEVIAQDPQLSVSFEPTPEGAKVLLKVPANYRPKSSQRKIIVRTDDKDIPSLEIPIRLARARPKSREKASGAAPWKIKGKPPVTHLQTGPRKRNSNAQPNARPPAKTTE